MKEKKSSPLLPKPRTAAGNRASPKISGRWPCPDNPCFGGKAPMRIKSVDVIDGTSLHVRRIVAFAQCRRDAGHHGRRNTPDMTRSRTVNMAAENSDDPPGVQQGLAQPRHHLRRFEMERVRPHRHLKRRMVRKNRNRLGGLGIDQVDQTSSPLGAKVALVAACTQGIDRDQSYGISPRSHSR